MGVATNPSDTSMGLMGLGRSGQELPSILTTMVSQGLINSNAFSLYLNDISMSSKPLHTSKSSICSRL